MMHPVILHVQNPPPEGGYLLEPKEAVMLAELLMAVALGVETWSPIVLQGEGKLSVSDNNAESARRAAKAIA